MKWIAVVCDEKVFKNVSERKDSSLDRGKNLNAFNVRVVQSKYKHVKVLYNGT